MCWPVCWAPNCPSRLGQPVIIENRPGAGGILAADAVAKSPPDGYTILQNTNGAAIAPALYKSLPFDAQRISPRSRSSSASNLVAGGQPELGHQFGARSDRARQGPAGQAQLRIERRRQSAAPDDGDAQARDRHRHPGRAVPRRRADQHCADRGRGRGGGGAAGTAVPLIKDGRLRAHRRHRRQALARRCRTCRPSRKAACRASIPPAGRAGSCREDAARRSSIASSRRRRRCWRCPTCSAHSAPWATRSIGSTPAKFEAFYRSEIVKFAKVIADAKIPKQ